jgi:hypothetical protein
VAQDRVIARWLLQYFDSERVLPVANKAEGQNARMGEFQDWIGLDWIGLDRIGLDWIGLDHTPYTVYRTLYTV